jgi:hypothetical protein
VDNADIQANLMVLQERVGEVKRLVEKCPACYEKIEIRVGKIENKINYFKGALWGLTAVSVIQLILNFWK